MTTLSEKLQDIRTQCEELKRQEQVLFQEALNFANIDSDDDRADLIWDFIFNDFGDLEHISEVFNTEQ